MASSAHKGFAFPLQFIASREKRYNYAPLQPKDRERKVGGGKNGEGKEGKRGGRTLISEQTGSCSSNMLHLDIFKNINDKIYDRWRLTGFYSL